MFTESRKNEIRRLCGIAEERLREKHIRCLACSDKPVIVISAAYNGIWLEHLYDAIIYAKLDPAGIPIMKNTIGMYLDAQRENGQLPCFIWDNGPGYSQIQECVSYARLCLEAYRLCGDIGLLRRCYASAAAWERWLREKRMVSGRGLVEMFVGYDTGHDNSGRLIGMAHRGNYSVDGKRMDADVLPPDETTAPILAVDMNCNYYATLRALAEMAELLDEDERAADYRARAAKVKELLFHYCYNEEDKFFYDVDRSGNQLKYRSSTILHLFLERVLDPAADAALIDEIYEGHIKNPDEFWTKIPFPSMAANDPTAGDRSLVPHSFFNCWGYFSQALIVLRCTLWMDAYGKSADFDYICEVWLNAWTDCYDKLKFGQELDPHTGEPSTSSEFYSSCMLFYLYAAKRLGLY